jgi:hypothetical protein
VKLKFKPILSFLIIFIISFTLLKFYNFGINETYNKIIVDASNLFARSFINKNKDLKRVFQLVYKKESETKEYILIGVGNTEIRTPNGGIAMFGMQVEYSSFAYFPLILLISLIIASPIPFYRRILALFGGIILIHIYILFKIIIVLLYAKDFDLTIALSWGDGMRSFVNYLHGLLITNTPTGTSILSCLLIWILISFRKPDFEKFREAYLGIITQEEPTILKVEEKKEVASPPVTKKIPVKTNIKIKKSGKKL